MKLYEEKYKRDVDRMDQDAWLSGLYVSRAIASCFSKNAKYPKKPYTYKEAQQSLEESVSASKIAAQNFRDFAEQFNKRFKKKGN